MYSSWVEWLPELNMCKWVLLLDPGATDVETVGYGKFQDSLISCIMSSKIVPAMCNAVHTSGSASVTIRVTKWVEYLNG